MDRFENFNLIELRLVYKDDIYLILKVILLGNVCKISWYSCDKITMTHIQISRQNGNGFFSNISHQK